MNETPITANFRSIADLHAEGAWGLARMLQSDGYQGVLTLYSGPVEGAEAYVTRRGRVEYVSGSPDLVRRYVREQQLARRRENRRAREDVLRSLGLRRVRAMQVNHDRVYHPTAD
jgi:23S rRNA A2030 N6-methylase RlmJ